MNRFKRLVTEVHRRSLWQVLSIYLVASWIGYQVISELTDGLGLPGWVPGFAIVLFLIGLPIVLATAFIQEGGPRRDAVSYSPRDLTLLPLEAVEEPPPSHHSLFTWKKALTGGALAFVLLGVIAGSYMGLRSAGIGPFGSLLAKGALDNRERVLIADFNDLSGDSMLAQAVTQAFRVSFAQSDVITVVEPAYVRGVLARMQREATSQMDTDLAREVALRDNIKAYVTGEIARVGGRYSLIGKLLSASDASVLATYAQEAADSTEILPAVDKLSRKLREKIGESLRTIRNDRPLEAVTTRSLEALRKYSQAEQVLDQMNDPGRGIALLKEAVALDTAFAMAWRKLATMYGNMGAPFSQIMEAHSKAYQHRDRLTDIERYLTAASYHTNITEDLAQAEQAYLNALEIQPTNYVAQNNIGLIYIRNRSFERARETYERAINSNPTRINLYINLVEVLLHLGQPDSASKVVTAVGKRFGETALFHFLNGQIGAVRREYPKVEQHLRLAAGDPNEVIFRARMPLAAAVAVQGRLAEAERLLTEVEQSELGQGRENIIVDLATARAEVDARVRNDPAAAYRRLEAALARMPLEKMPVENRPYTRLAASYAMSGHPERARPLLLAQSQLSRELRGDDRGRVAHAEAWIALAEKRFADAITSFGFASTRGTCRRCDHVELGIAHELAGQPDSALARYEYWLATPDGDEQLFQDAVRLGPVYERLADLHERRGDRQKAAYYAAQLVDLWQNADAELQPRVQAARRALDRLRTDR